MNIKTLGYGNQHWQWIGDRETRLTCFVCVCVRFHIFEELLCGCSEVIA